MQPFNGVRPPSADSRCAPGCRRIPSSCTAVTWRSAGSIASATSCSASGSAGSSTSRRATPARHGWHSSARRSRIARGSPPPAACSTRPPCTTPSSSCPHDPRADILLRSGYLCLGRIAASFEIQFDPDPRPDDPICVSRAEFDDVCQQLGDAGVPLVADLDQGWRDFAGWRVNYDAGARRAGLAARRPTRAVVERPPGGEGAALDHPPPCVAGRRASRLLTAIGRREHRIPTIGP